MITIKGNLFIHYEVLRKKIIDEIKIHGVPITLKHVYMVIKYNIHINLLFNFSFYCH